MNKSKKSSSWITKIIKHLSTDKNERATLLEEIQEAHKKGVIDAEALAMIEGVFQVSEMRVRDIMVPRAHMVVLHDDMPVQDMLPLIASSGHSRFPVVDENLDEIVGILLAKDLSRYSDEKSRSEFELKDIMRPAVFVPESKRLNVLLKDFRSSRNHMAIVIDEYGGVAGLVTIEDVLEQIVGAIDDEHDDTEASNIQRHGYHRYSVRGLTPISDFNEFFGSDFNNDQFDTIAGFVTHEIGHLPERGEEAIIGKFQFKVISANSRRINNLQVTVLANSETQEEGALAG
ncbi:MAG: CBS domain-containing protein [Gammaproteobacteria bacterium]|jgi:magnesium and cobalt transporter|nr:CBS domain-containing protein [Gammaproteobacteria bacterium]